MMGGKAKGLTSLTRTIANVEGSVFTRSHARILGPATVHAWLLLLGEVIWYARAVNAKATNKKSDKSALLSMSRYNKVKIMSKVAIKL